MSKLFLAVSMLVLQSLSGFTPARAMHGEEMESASLPTKISLVEDVKSLDELKTLTRNQLTNYFEEIKGPEFLTEGFAAAWNYLIDSMSFDSPCKTIGSKGLNPFLAALHHLTQDSITKPHVDLKDMSKTYADLIKLKELSKDLKSKSTDFQIYFTNHLAEKSFPVRRPFPEGVRVVQNEEGYTILGDSSGKEVFTRWPLIFRSTITRSSRLRTYFTSVFSLLHYELKTKGTLAAFTTKKSIDAAILELLKSE